MNRLRRSLKPLYQAALRVATEMLRLIGRATIRLGGPVDFFSAWDAPGEASVVQAGQVMRPAKPDSLRVTCGLEQHNRQPWPIFYRRISPARLVGKSLGVMNGSKKLMAESVYDRKYGSTDPSFTYWVLPRATRLAGAWTSLICRWCPTSGGAYYHYHWMLDALPRLALLDRFPDHTQILIPPSPNAVQRETLDILKVADRCRPTPEIHLVVDDYYFSAFPAMTGCDNPYAIQFLRKHFLPAASEGIVRPEKIYVSRLGSARSAHGEDRMIAALEQEGWTIVDPQKYSLRDQIALFSEAKAVCAIHGAGLVNLLWCPPGCRVLELCPANYLNGCYEGLAAYLDLDYRHMIFDADERHRLKVDMPRFRAAVRAIDEALEPR